MYEVEMLCENVGIINLGELAAFDTPQGLKDNLMHRNEQDLLSEMEALSSASEFANILSTEDSSVANLKDSSLKDNLLKNNSLKDSLLKDEINGQIIGIAPSQILLNGDVDSPEYLAELKRRSKEVSVLVKNMTDKIKNDLENLDVVYKIDMADTEEGSRLTIAVDKFSQESVNNVIWSIVKNDGNITSINTRDPSLEDVFVDVTSKKTINEANIKEMED
jgi:ABC-2 type transport system ATP-binding protein